MKQPEDNKTVDIEDVILWSDSTWCYRYELHEMSHKSDDYEVLYVGTDSYMNFLMGYSWC